MKHLMVNGKHTFLYICLLQISLCVTFGQQPSSTARCQVSTSPPLVRAEGLTERLGDIVLQCSGAVPGTLFSGNVTVIFSVSVTNRVDANNLTRDAVVSVDLGSGFVPTAIAGQVSGNSISFNGISYTAPASGNVNLRISNVRAAMNQLGLTSAVPATVTAFLSSSLAVDQSQLVVAYSQAVGQYMPGSGALVLVRVLGADATGAGGYAVAAPQGAGPVTLGSVSEVTLTNGSGYAVYE